MSIQLPLIFQYFAVELPDKIRAGPSDMPHGE